MNKPTMFSSGVELGNLLLSSDLLHHSWDAIDQLYRETPPNHDPTASPLSIKYKVHQQSPVGTIISFVSSPPCTPQYLQTEGRDLLASSDALGTENFPLFQFVGTKVNPTFSLHRAAVTLFTSLQDQLSDLKTQAAFFELFREHVYGGKLFPRKVSFKSGLSKAEIARLRKQLVYSGSVNNLFTAGSMNKSIASVSIAFYFN